MQLSARDYPAYFQALEEERTITAHHAAGRSPHARAGRQLPAAAGHHLDAGRPHPAAGQDDRGAVPRTRRHAPGLVGRRAELRRLAGGLRVAGDRRRRSQERRAPAGRPGGRAGPVQRRAGTVRLGRLARPAGAAAHGAELRQPAAVALPGPAGRRRRPVHQPRGRGREADARVHQRAAGVLTRRTGRRQLGRDRRQPGGGRGGVQPGGPDRRDRRRGGAGEAAGGARGREPPDPGAAEPDRERHQVPARRGEAAGRGERPSGGAATGCSR